MRLLNGWDVRGSLSVALGFILLATSFSGCGPGVTQVASTQGSGRLQKVGGTSGLPPIPGVLPAGIVTSIDHTNVALSNQDPPTIGASSSLMPQSAAVTATLAVTPGRVVAAQLMVLHDPTLASGEAVWAVDVIPASGFTPRLGSFIGSSGTSGTSGTGRSNFEVDFVNAISGAWLFSVEAYDPQLPAGTS